MSYQLTLAIDRNGNGLFADVLRLAATSRSLPEDISKHGRPFRGLAEFHTDDGLQSLSACPSGQPLRWIRAGDLAGLLEVHAQWQSPDKPWDAAITAFLKALPESTKVLMIWS